MQSSTRTFLLQDLYYSDRLPFYKVVFLSLMHLNLLKLQMFGIKYVNNLRINLYFLPYSNNKLIDFTYISMVKFCLKYV